MRIRTVLATMAGATALFSFTAASAQLPMVPVTPMGFFIRAGIFKPSSGSGSAFGDSWFTGGVEMDLFKLRVSQVSARITASIDSYSSGGASAVPVLLNYTVKVDKLKYSAGTGVSFVNRPTFKSSIKLGYQFSLGYDLPVGVPVTAEVRFFGASGGSAIFDGFAFTLGYRM